jgi:hypothetical protein
MTSRCINNSRAPFSQTLQLRNRQVPPGEEEHLDGGTGHLVMLLRMRDSATMSIYWPVNDEHVHLKWGATLPYRITLSTNYDLDNIILTKRYSTHIWPRQGARQTRTLSVGTIGPNRELGLYRFLVIYISLYPCFNGLLNWHVSNPVFLMQGPLYSHSVSSFLRNFNQKSQADIDPIVLGSIY